MKINSLDSSTQRLWSGLDRRGKIKGKTYEITNLSAVLFVNTGAFDGS